MKEKNIASLFFCPCDLSLPIYSRTRHDTKACNVVWPERECKKFLTKPISRSIF